MNRGISASRTTLIGMNQSDIKGKTGAGSKAQCSTGGCGGPGLCPGIALLLAYAAGTGIVYLSGLVWLGWLVGVVAALVLITGAWRFLPGRST